MKHFLILLFLLPACASAQVNWNQVFGKQRFQQGLGLPSTDTGNFRTPVDTSAIVLNRADSTVYFRYKGKWKTLASGGAGATPSLSEVMDVSSFVRTTIAKPNKNIYFSDTIGRQTSTLSLAIGGGSSPSLTFTQSAIGSTGDYNVSSVALSQNINVGNAKAGNIAFGKQNTSDSFDFGLSFGKLITNARRILTSKFTNNTQDQLFKIYIPESNGTLTNKILLNGSTFNTDDNGQINLGTIGGSGTVTSISQGYGLSASPNPIIATGTISVDSATLSAKYLRQTDTAALVSRIDNKMSGLDIMRLMGYTMKAEPYGVTLSQITSQLSTVTQQLTFYPFYWNVSDSIRGVSWFNRTTSTTNQSNYNGVAIYSYSAGTFTRLTFTPNDSTFWDAATANTWKSMSITPYYLAKGLYFIAYQISGTGALPTFGSGDALVIAGTSSPSFPPTEVNPNGLKFSCYVANATTTPPLTVAASTTNFKAGIPYFMFY